MSVQNDTFGSSSFNNNNNFSLLNIYSRVTDGTNYNAWMRNIKMAICFKEKEYVLDKPREDIDEEKDTP